MSKLFFFTAILFSLSPAYAGESATAVCTPALVVLEKVTHCEENGAYLKQAADCRKNLEAEVQRSGVRLQAAIGSSAATGGQAARFAEGVKDYAAATASLERLIKLSALAQAGVAAYLGTVVHPEDIENPEIAGDDQQAFADGVPCYGETVKGVRAEMARIARIQAELEAGRAEAAKLGGLAGARQQTVGADSARARTVETGPLGEGAGKSAKPAGHGAQPLEGSGISGTENLNKPVAK